MKVKIGGIIDMSTVDYSGKISSVIFFYGCNFRCPFCYNIKLLEGNDYREEKVSDLLDSINENIDFIDAVVFTGGEPTLQFDALKKLCFGLKSKKISLKLDTNGYNPEKLRELLNGNLLDFVSMDVKSSAERYDKFSGIKCDINRVKESLNVLRESSVDYELRTTIVPGMNDDEKDIISICNLIKPAKRYVLQQFRGVNGTFDSKLSALPNTKRSKLIDLSKIPKKFGIEVSIRTEEKGEERV